MPRLNIELDDILHNLSQSFFDDHIKDKLERYRGKNYSDFLSDILTIGVMDIINPNDSDDTINIDLTMKKETYDRICSASQKYGLKNDELISEILFVGLQGLQELE